MNRVAPHLRFIAGTLMIGVVVTVLMMPLLGARHASAVVAVVPAMLLGHALFAPALLGAKAGLLRAVKVLRLFGGGQRTFEGVVEGNRFRVWRIIQYHNSFRPAIVGTVEPTPSGSRLRGTMSINPLVAIFLFVWFSAAIASGIGALAGPADTPPLKRLLPVGMLVFGWILASGGYTIEARAARERLQEIAGVTTGHLPPRRETPA